jgi:hypothetical protein
MTWPHPVLSLDALADHPELTRQLPRDEAFRLYLKAQAVAEACALAMLTAGVPARRDDPDPDELIDAKMVARILHRSVSWVQQGARTAPLKFCLMQSLGRGLLFSRISLVGLSDSGRQQQVLSRPSIWRERRARAIIRVDLGRRTTWQTGFGLGLLGRQ